MESLLAAFTSPVVLFFALGIGAGLLRSSLSVPEALSKGLSLYLMVAIGFKGGVEMAHAGLDPTMVKGVLAGLAAGFGLPVIAYFFLRRISQLTPIDAAAVAAHYGSISVVTFVAATDHLVRIDEDYDGFMIAIVALMETPAIVAGLWLASLHGGKKRRWDGELLREVFLNGSVVLLLGSLLIGIVSGDEGMEAVSPFIVDPFKGVLCLFLLDMGLTAANRLRSAKALDIHLAGFGVLMPLVGASVGLGLAALAGLSVGSATLFVVLCASASYIAVPAAMRLALPQANPAYSLGLSLGVTFPFNVAIGIPLYSWAVNALLSGS